MTQRKIFFRGGENRFVQTAENKIMLNSLLLVPTIRQLLQPLSHVNKESLQSNTNQGHCIVMNSLAAGQINRNEQGAKSTLHRQGLRELKEVKLLAQFVLRPIKILRKFWQEGRKGGWGVVQCSKSLCVVVASSYRYYSGLAVALHCAI